MLPIPSAARAIARAAPCAKPSVPPLRAVVAVVSASAIVECASGGRATTTSSKWSKKNRRPKRPGVRAVNGLKLPSQSMRVCFWSTTFQADNQAFAYYLSEQPGVDVVVAMHKPDLYAREAIHEVIPFRGRFLDAEAPRTRREIEAFAPDVVIIDNHLPSFPIARRLFVLWHGFGWRIDDLSVMRKQLARFVGDVTRKNDRFRWHAFGEWDRRYRIEHSKLAPENVLALGSTYSDWLLADGPVRRGFDRAKVQPSYTIDLSRQTVLVALTWHHGGSLGHWGDEAELLGRVFDHIQHRGANVLVRMHDRHRYDTAYLDMMERLVRNRTAVQLKFKSSAPDSFVDLLVSDVMVSNYSSILNGFYFTGKPSVHIDPADSGEARPYYRKWQGGKVRKIRVDGPAQLWKLDPGEIGGLRARSFPELLSELDEALSAPNCCAEQARAFCARYIESVDGRTCERTLNTLRAWMG